MADVGVSLYTATSVNPPSEKQSHKLLVVLTVFLALFTAISISIMCYSIKSNEGLNTRKENQADTLMSSIIDKIPDAFLPTKFSVNEDFLLPPSNQMSRGTCWIFATMFLLESQYRANGIKKGFLEKNEYVSFSKQAYGSWVLQKCQENNTAGVCHHGAPAHNTTDDHLIPTLYYLLKAFPDLEHSILPESICPYYPTDSYETDLKCDGMWESIQTNPISFEIKSMEVARDIRSTKKLLVKSRRPLGLSFPIPSFIYYAPCDGEGSFYSDKDECTKNSVPCPSDYTAKQCARIEITSMDRGDSTFSYIDDITRVVPAGAHEIDIVAYNDDWIHKNRKISSRTLPTEKGGFITHNSWRSNGHSVDYYMGRLSEENEAVICPNHNMSTNWIPTTYSDIVNSKGDVTKCGTSIKRVRGKGMANHTDLLMCINSRYCDLNRNYALLMLPGSEDAWAEPLHTGFDETHMVSWNKDGTDFRNETFNFLPFHMLHNVFVPDNFVPNDPDNCGYWIIPYKTVNMVSAYTWDLLDTYYVVDMHLEFPNHAYLRSSESKNYNTTLLKESTHNFNKVDFDGPLPYKYVY